MKYSIDTSMLIECWVRRYPPDIFVKFWDAMEKNIHSGTLIATEVVWGEITNKDDELQEWLKPLRSMFIELDEEIQLTVSQMLLKFPEIAKKRLDKTTADAFVVALAKNHDCVVVTEENRNKKLGIPELCEHYDVKWTNTIGLLRELGIKF